MKRKFAVLATLGALALLALPTESMATIRPLGSPLEIHGGPAGPKLTTSLGYCTVSKIAGTIPTTDQQAASFPITIPTIGTCSSGTTVALTGNWFFEPKSYGVVVKASLNNSITMKFASLPGCKLSNAGPVSLWGTWYNNTPTPNTPGYYYEGKFHAAGGIELTWLTDGGSCALAGSKETLSWEDLSEGSFGSKVPLFQTVNDRSHAVFVTP